MNSTNNITDTLSEADAINILMKPDPHPGETNSEYADRQRYQKKFIERLQNADPESVPAGLKKYIKGDKECP